MLEPTAIRAELDRILSSTPFATSHRSKQFLRYIVENSFDHTHESLKEYAIALAVFDRDASYDPAIDATVRVEAGRLRSRLRDYYAGEGRKDTLIINVPKGRLPGHLCRAAAPGRTSQVKRQLSVVKRMAEAADSALLASRYSQEKDTACARRFAGAGPPESSAVFSNGKGVAAPNRS